jgi:hypothetical protein
MGTFLGPVLGLAGSLLAPKSQGGWSGPPPVAEASQEEKDLLSAQQPMFSEIINTWMKNNPQYQDRMNMLWSGQLSPNFEQNWIAGNQRGIDATIGKALSSLNKRGILSSSATTAATDSIQKDVQANLAQNRLNTINLLGDMENKKYAMFSDNLKYPYNAWNSMRGQRYTNSNNQGYKPAEPNPMTGIMNGIGGMFNWGGGSSGGGSNNIVGPLPGLNAGNAWGNASYW